MLIDNEPEPMDYYDEYSKWLMVNFPERIHNSDSLVAHLEDAYEFDMFLRERSRHA